MDIQVDFNFEKQPSIEATFELQVAQGSNDYDELVNKPSINDVILQGNLNTKDLNLDLKDCDNSSSLFQSLSEVEDLISEHNTSLEAHEDIRENIRSVLDDVDEISQDLTNKISDIANNLSEEILNRENSDNQLQQNIDVESSTREQADSTLQNNINALSNNLSEESSTRENADNTLQNNINKLSSNLSEEILNREQADSTLQNNINALSNNLSEESSTREQADSTLQNNINALSNNLSEESSTRENADTVLQNNITLLSNEVSTIESNINDLSDNLSAEITDREEADNNINNEINNVKNDLLSEITNRENADNNLQQQIDAISSSSDVIDIVDTYTDLQNYDTAHVKENDIIKVLDDATHNNAPSYYRWVITDHVGAWVYVGSESVSYTKSEADERFVPQTREINGYPLNANINLDYEDVGAQKPLIPGTGIDIDDDVIRISDSYTVSITPRFSVNNGNVNNQGTMDVLAYSGSTLSFKVDDGTNYKPLICTEGYDGAQFVKESLNPVSVQAEGLSANTYNVFVSKGNNTPYLLANTIFIQAEKPADTPTDTIPIMTSNTAPYGTVTSNTNITVQGGVTVQPYLMFQQGAISQAPWYASSTENGTITYTYDENYQPQPGLYNFKFTTNERRYADYYSVLIYNFKFYLSDGSTIQYTVNRILDSKEVINYTFNCSSSITKIEMNFRSYTTSSRSNKMLGTLQLLKPAILDEGTLWVNNGVEPLEVMARDSNSQWQPFNDVLVGTCTVNSSYNITGITNIGFNKFSAVNMHNISTIAHEDIRGNIQDLQALTIQINRTGTASYKGLTKLYTSTGTATDGTMTQNAITNALNAQGHINKIALQNDEVLTPDTNNKVNWVINNTLNTSDVLVQVKKISDNSLVGVDVISTASTITITMNATDSIPVGTYKVIIIG